MLYSYIPPLSEMTKQIIVEFAFHNYLHNVCKLQKSMDALKNINSLVHPYFYMNINIVILHKDNLF